MLRNDHVQSAGHRTRRNVVKAAGLVLGAFGASLAVSKSASADDDGGRDKGGDGGGNCFLRGTRIRTTKGYRKIETLSVGDLVPTRFGGACPIRKIKSFSINRSGAGWSGDVAVVRVGRGALDDNVPAADLCVTAAHAVFVDGVLVPIGNLVNGRTIAFDDFTNRDELEFFHVELEKHDVIDAEGAACESLLGPSMAPCAPVLTFNGGGSELRSRLRSAASILIDRREPLDIIRDDLEERGFLLGRAVMTPRAPQGAI
jgi:Hint domain